jgi:Middle or third domain of peptidase_M16
VKFGFVTQTDGLLLTMSGFNHKLPTLLQHILDMLYHLDFSDEMFEMYRENLKREYDNFAKSQPYQQCLTNTMCLLQSVRAAFFVSVTLSAFANLLMLSFP